MKSHYILDDLEEYLNEQMEFSITGRGINNEQRTGRNDGKLDTNTEATNTAELPEQADYPHDRTDRDSEH